MDNCLHLNNKTHTITIDIRLLEKNADKNESTSSQIVLRNAYKSFE